MVAIKVAYKFSQIIVWALMIVRYDVGIGLDYFQQNSYFLKEKKTWHT